MSGAARPKRFWTAATVEPVEGGFTVALDGRPLRTPAKAACIVPGRALAEALAAEWNGVGELLDPGAMPLTRAANTAIDRVAPNADAVRADLAGFAETDLLCHRAGFPEELAAREAEGWDPLLAWAGEALGARLIAVEGVMPEAQPPQAVARLSAELEPADPWELTALHDLVVLSGSLVLALAVSHGRLTAEAAWTLSRIDEDWQISLWGEDAEAAAAAETRRRAFRDAARLLDLLRRG